MNICNCPKGGISTGCPVHGNQATEAMIRMISAGGDLNPVEEAVLNGQIQQTVKSITRMNDIKARFTMVLPFEDVERGKVYSVWFKIDNAHRWCISPVPVVEKEKAEMMREQFARDLERVLEKLK